MVSLSAIRTHLVDVSKKERESSRKLKNVVSIHEGGVWRRMLLPQTERVLPQILINRVEFCSLRQKQARKARFIQHRRARKKRI